MCKMNGGDLNVDDQLKQFAENVGKYVEDDDDRNFVNYIAKCKENMIESAFNSKEFYDILDKSSNLTNSNGFYMLLNQIVDYIKSNQKPKVKKRVVAQKVAVTIPQPTPPSPPLTDNNREEENTSSTNVENSTVNNSSPKTSNQSSSITSNNESGSTAAASNDHENAVATTSNHDNSDISDDNSDDSQKEEKLERLSESDKRTKTNLFRLQEALINISKKIKELESQELNLDDLDNEESAYIAEDRYKKHFVKTYKKYRQLLRDNTHLVDDSFTYNVANYSCSRRIKIPVRITRYPEINKRIEEHFSKKKKDMFPNYSEILNIITKASNEHNLNLKEERMKKVAEMAFREIGRILKTKRLHEEYDVLLSHIDSDENQVIDPATNDNELNRKLQENQENSKNKIKEIIDSYVRKQDNGEDFSDEESNNDKESDTDNDDDDEDDDDDDDDDDSDDKNDDDNEEVEKEGEDDVQISDQSNQTSPSCGEESNEPAYPIISVSKALNGHDSKNESAAITTNGSTNGSSLIEGKNLPREEESSGQLKRRRRLSEIFRKDDALASNSAIDNNEECVSGSIDKRLRLTEETDIEHQVTVANGNKNGNDPLLKIIKIEGDRTPQQVTKKATRSESQKVPINNNDDDDIIVLD